MSKSILTQRFAALLTKPARPPTVTHFPARFLSTTPKTAANLNSENISKITEKEKEITGQDDPVKGGPTAQAQKHASQPLTSEAISDITKGEKKITDGERVQGGPTSTAQSLASKGPNQSNNSANGANANPPSGVLDSETISKVTDAEKTITGSNEPTSGGPTAKAQSHAGEPITSEILHDVTEGEKKITGGERVKGGPTSTLQSELGKSRNN